MTNQKFCINNQEKERQEQTAHNPRDIIKEETLG